MKPTKAHEEAAEKLKDILLVDPEVDWSPIIATFLAAFEARAKAEAFEEAGDWIVRDGIGFITVGEVKKSLYRKAKAMREVAP